MTESRGSNGPRACLSQIVGKPPLQSSQRPMRQGTCRWHHECTIRHKLSRLTHRIRGHTPRFVDHGVNFVGSVMSIDSYRFLDFATRQVMKAWAARQQAGVIPFTRLAKPLSECTVALVST